MLKWIKNPHRCFTLADTDTKAVITVFQMFRRQVLIEDDSD